VHDKSDVRLHWAAGEDAQCALDTRDVLAWSFQQAGDRLLADRPVDRDPERPVLVVLDHQDHGVGKARVADIGRGDQQLPGQRTGRGGIGCHGREKHRRQQSGSWQ